MDNEKQQDELTALESIYINEEFSFTNGNNQFECTLKIFLNLPEDYHFTYKDIRQAEEDPTKILISHLPPLTVLITLPPNYPSVSPPVFTLISSWLCPPLLSKLCRKLDQLWEENKGEEVLFIWFAFLQNETLEFLNIRESLSISHIYTRYKMALENIQNQENLILEDNASGINKKARETSAKYRKEAVNGRYESDPNFSPKKRYRRQRNKTFDKRAVFDRPVSSDPVQTLIDYNELRNQIEFKKNFYTCKICFSDKLGKDCTQFVPCSHVFCKNCIVGYLEVRIKDGAVQDILCPEDQCLSEAAPDQIKELLSPDLFNKYDSILLNTTLSAMADIVYCPRRHCQYPVSREANELATCPVCQCAFCVYCKMVYHGIEPCKLNSGDKQRLVTEYKNASPAEKEHLEKRYGKKQLQRLVDNTMSEKWISNNSQNCPHCKVAIEKYDGCNKMVCGQCNTFFCWLCNERLNPRDPYQHYRSQQSNCFNRLNEGIVMDVEDDDDIEEDPDFLEDLAFPEDFEGLRVEDIVFIVTEDEESFDEIDINAI